MTENWRIVHNDDKCMEDLRDEIEFLKAENKRLLEIISYYEVDTNDIHPHIDDNNGQN